MMPRIYSLGIIFISFLFIGSQIWDFDNSISERDFGGYKIRDVLEITSRDRSNAEVFLNTQGKMPRYNYFTNGRKFITINSTFCNMDENGACRWLQYAESIGFIIAVPFIIVIFSFLAGILFWSFRKCCCGGCLPSEGFCLPGRELSVLDGEGYKKSTVLILKIIAWLLLIISVCFGTLGFVGNAKISGALSDGMNETITSTVEIVQELQYIAQEFGRLEISSISGLNVNETLQSAISKGDEFYNIAVSIRDVLLSDFNVKRESIMMAAFLIAVLLLLMVAIGAIVNTGKLSIAMATLGFLAVSFLWASFAVHLSVLTVVSDFCRGIEVGLSTSSQYGQIFNVFINCENSTEFGGLQTAIDDAYNLILYDGCTRVENVCSMMVPCYGDPVNKTANCSLADCSSVNFSNCTRKTLEQMSNATIADYILGCPTGLDSNGVPQFISSTCPTDSPSSCSAWVCRPISYYSLQTCRFLCRSPESREIAQTISRTLDKLTGIVNLKEDHLDPLLRCKQITNLFVSVQDILCVSTATAIGYVTIGSGMIGCALLIGSSLVIQNSHLLGLVASILSLKRFEKRYMEISYNSSI